MASETKSGFHTSDDGLRLHHLDFRPADDGGRVPVVCLPGLTRGADDFRPLGEALASASERPRRVIAFDYRGRGLSDHDPDPRHYDLPTERADFLAGLALLGVERAHFVGTSRGGLHVMAMAPTERARIASVVFNDIGPVLELDGLRRIKAYVGKPVAPANLKDAIRVLRIGAGQHFDGLSPEEWRHFATTTFGGDEDDLRLRYDPALARSLDALDLDTPWPESWDLFDALEGLPVLTLRGANSDLLSDATLAAMKGRWAGSDTRVVPGQGHAPLLADSATIEAIRAFLVAADRS